ncbi:MAG TPA: hypothetical protein VHX16_09060 [Chloroflexota bacterium]|jgi:hypothetical protein|nr:hypothetical protein [Chloroflexota bacterium]
MDGFPVIRFGRCVNPRTLTTATDVVYRCAQCGEPIHVGNGVVAWPRWNPETLIVLHKDAPVGRCDSEYQRLNGTLHEAWDLARFLAALAENRL